MEFEYKVSSVNGTGSDGAVALWYNGQLVANQTGINNYLLQYTNQVTFGFLEATPENFSPAYLYFDNCKVSNGYIEPT